MDCSLQYVGGSLDGMNTPFKSSIEVLRDSDIFDRQLDTLDKSSNEIYWSDKQFTGVILFARLVSREWFYAEIDKMLKAPESPPPA